MSDFPVPVDSDLSLRRGCFSFPKGLMQHLTKFEIKPNEVRRSTSLGLESKFVTFLIVH